MARLAILYIINKFQEFQWDYFVLKCKHVKLVNK